jgi:hypothetical protein
MLVSALVSAETEKAIEIFLRPANAERTLAEALVDEPEWADILSVEEVELAGAELSPS